MNAKLLTLCCGIIALGIFLFVVNWYVTVITEYPLGIQPTTPEQLEEELFYLQAFGLHFTNEELMGLCNLTNESFGLYKIKIIGESMPPEDTIGLPLKEPWYRCEIIEVTE